MVMKIEKVDRFKVDFDYRHRQDLLIKRMQGFIENNGIYRYILLLDDARIIQGTLDCHSCPSHKFVAVLCIFKKRYENFKL